MDDESEPPLKLRDEGVNVGSVDEERLGEWRACGASNELMEDGP